MGCARVAAQDLTTEARAMDQSKIDAARKAYDAAVRPARKA